MNITPQPYPLWIVFEYCTGVSPDPGTAILFGEPQLVIGWAPDPKAEDDANVPWVLDDCCGCVVPLRHGAAKDVDLYYWRTFTDYAAALQARDKFTMEFVRFYGTTPGNMREVVAA